MLDYHVHTRYCRHADGSITDYVKKAVAMGLREVGFADHYPMFYLPPLPYDDYSMTLKELPAYLGEIEEVGGRFRGRMGVKAGVEVDYYRGCESLLEKHLSHHEFDYLIGVVHLLDDWVIDDERNAPLYGRVDLDDLYSRYFGEVEASIRSGLFDIIGHIDVVKRFNYIPEGGVERYVLPCLDLIVEKGLCLEVNTSGLDRPVRDTYPGLSLFTLMRERGVEVTLGSDAHKPGEVGRHFESVVKALKGSGYSRVATFTRRKRGFTDI